MRRLVYKQEGGSVEDEAFRRQSQIAEGGECAHLSSLIRKLIIKDYISHVPPSLTIVSRPLPPPLK